MDEIDLVLFTSAQGLEWTALANSFVRETFLSRAGAACRLSPAVINAFSAAAFSADAAERSILECRRYSAGIARENALDGDGNGKSSKGATNIMKLYYAPGACSLSPHIVSCEAGLDLELERTDLVQKKTESGQDFWSVNPKGQVPVLEIEDGQKLTEGAAIVQYLGDRKPGSGLLPEVNTIDRYRVQEWLSFVGSELHKTFGPLFRPSTPEEFKTSVQRGT